MTLNADQPTVVLTGASAGIGLATLEALVENAFVIAVSRTPPQVNHPNCLWLRGDLQCSEQIAAAISDELQVSDRSLDGIIHCAGSYGSSERHSLADTPPSEWDELIAVNVRCQFVLTVRLLPFLLRRPRAFIVGISSDAAILPAPGRVAYGCSKAASHAMFAGLAAELDLSTVSVIELTPAGQVVTRGIRRRRPPDHDFTGYSAPQIFQAPMQWIVLTRGEGMNGMHLIVS